MTDNTQLTDARLQSMHAAIGELTLASGAIDNSLTFLLGRLMGPPTQSVDYSQPSVFIFNARSFDQRRDLILRYFEYRFDGALKKPKHDSNRRSLDFIRKMMDTIFSNIKRDLNVRNTAAHGTILDYGDGTLYLVPTFFDDHALEKLSKNKSENKGLTAGQLIASANNLKASIGHIQKLTFVILSGMETNPSLAKFLAEANALARDLGLSETHIQDPKEGPPLRKKRSK